MTLAHTHGFSTFYQIRQALAVLFALFLTGASTVTVLFVIFAHAGGI
jgi:hypothetical protein